MRKLYLAVLGLLLLATPSQATILFAGGEDTSFTAVGTVTYGGNTNSFRTGYGRVNFVAQNGTSTADPPANRFQTPTFTASSNIWIHARFWSQTATTTSGVQGLIVRSPDGVSRIIVRQTGTDGTLKVSTRNSAGTITDLATSSVIYTTGAGTPSSINTFDLNINYTCSGSGGVTLYINGTQGINYTGNPCTDAATTLNQVDFASFTNNAAPNCGATGGTCWSEAIIATADTRGMSLWSLTPQAAGTSQQWTPNTLANINKTTIDDLTSIGSSSNNQLTEWTTPVTPPAGTWALLAVVQEARVNRGTTGPQNFEWLLRTKDGTQNVTGSNAPGTSFGNFSNQIWSLNPFTSGAWDITDIASGFNLGIESLP